ncbi:MAG TPA: right-handed parallel beta-helix repeat-containing protein, partial [candidate division Zixibacteria bacterium]|nr:right-handed parallel beta-helix repeat-containing protein [candidate division Zixibacteria bacterium]
MPSPRPLTNTAKSLILLVVSLFAFPALSSGTIIAVPGDEPTIQDGVDAANPGDTVQVAAGVYSGPGNRDIDAGGKNLVIRSTDGDPGTCVIDCGGSELEPHRAFLFENGESAATIVEGFTIENGWGPLFLYGEGVDTVSVSIGGGIACLGSSPTLRDILFRNNTAYAGGAVICGFGSASHIRDCRFDDNSAYWFTDQADGNGGAVFSFESNISLSNCDFYNNASDNIGGAVSVDGEVATSILIDSCVFAYNSAGEAGGAVNAFMATVTITNSLFHENSTDYIGGAVYIESSPGQSDITSCTFDGNATSGVSAYGSAIYSEFSGSLDIERCIITGGSGGYVPIGCDFGVSLTVSCSDIYGNSPGDWVDCLTGLDGLNNNFSADPLYCLADS